jgi:hypothetical protein
MPTSTLEAADCEKVRATARRAVIKMQDTKEAKAPTPVPQSPH